MNNFLEVSEEKVNEQREEQGAGENHPFGLVASEVSVGSVSLFANPPADAAPEPASEGSDGYFAEKNDVDGISKFSPGNQQSHHHDVDDPDDGIVMFAENLARRCHLPSKSWQKCRSCWEKLNHETLKKVCCCSVHQSDGNCRFPECDSYRWLKLIFQK